LILAFCRALERLNYDSLNIAFAESIALARIILMDGGNGLGIKNYFGEAAREGKYKNKDALYIKIRNYTHVVVFVGCSQSNSYEGIRGMTISCAIGTEINLAHRSFMEEVVARTLLTPIKHRRLFFDLNPTIDSHFIYTDFIDRWVDDARSGKLIGGVNYETCSLYENPALTEEQAVQIASQYDETSNFYKALILGMRVNVVDTVYTLYNYNLAATLLLMEPLEYIIAVDIGISASATTFICGGKAANGKIYIYDFYYHRNGKNSVEGAKEYEEYGNDLVQFYKKQQERFKGSPRYVFIDRDITMLRILTRRFKEEDIPASKLNYVIKDKIEQRITTVRNRLYRGEIIIDDSLDLLKKGITNAVYDPKEKDKGKLLRLDDTSLDFNPIDCVDVLEYLMSYFDRTK
jgi:PBSX family phage terminase large subunit